MLASCSEVGEGDHTGMPQRELAPHWLHGHDILEGGQRDLVNDLISGGL